MIALALAVGKALPFRSEREMLCRTVIAVVHSGIVLLKQLGTKPCLTAAGLPAEKTHLTALAPGI